VASSVEMVLFTRLWFLTEGGVIMADEQNTRDRIYEMMKKKFEVMKKERALKVWMFEDDSIIFTDE
jgi:hypothetical protein